MLRRPRQANDQGETLLELIIAIAIMGIAVVAIAGGITTTVLVSDSHRKQATAGAYVRSYGEAIQNTVATSGYVECATTTTPSYLSPAGFSLPSNISYTASITEVQYATSTGGWSTSCGSNGAERLRLQVRSADGRANEELLVVVRKCGASCS
jgi:type II secretory pathway pseudopilin PulG